MLKTALIISMLTLTVSGIIFIFQNTNLPEQTALTQPTLKPFLEPLNIEEIKSEINRHKQSSLGEQIQNSDSEEKITASQKSENLTLSFTEKISEMFRQNNPNGPEHIDGKPWLNVPDPNSVTEDLLSEAAKTFDFNRLKPIIKDSDLKISDKTDSNSLIAYFQAFNQILSANSKNIPQEIINDPENISLATVRQLIPVYKETISELFALTAPKPVLQIHKKELELLSEKTAILEKISLYENDPILAILAAEEIKNLDKKFLNFSEEIKQFIKNG